MHGLSYLAIKNFRACKDVALPLGSYTPLVGQNNTGKSTILEAISWILSASPSALRAEDPADSSKPVVVAACIAGITSALLEQIPEKKHKTAIEPYCKDGVLWIRNTCSGTKKSDVKQEVWDPESYAGDGVPANWKNYPTGLPQAVSALLPDPLFVEAMQDIEEDLGKAKAGTTIKDLLDEIMGPVLKAHEDLNKAIDTIRQILTTSGTSRSEHLKTFDEQATQTLENFFPGLSIDLDLQIVDIKEFFKAGDLRVKDKTTGDHRRFDQMGTGAQRAIQMALVRYLAESRKSEQDQVATRLLLIDEPELYLHPQGVRRLRQALQSLSQSGFQVVLSTHSPLMLNRENAAHTVIVNKNKDTGTEARVPLEQAVHKALTDAQSQSRALFELGSLSEIYFSERVVLCEGKTDRRLLPLAYEKLYGQPPDMDQIAFVAFSGCNDIPKTLPVLKAMGIKACAIADLDFAFRGARTVQPALLPKADQETTDAAAVITGLSAKHGFLLDNDSLPRKGSGWLPAEAWTLFAEDPAGKTVADRVQDILKASGVWVWKEGCIENVTGAKNKGEDAIIEQEEMLRAMTGAAIEQNMPAFKACFEWIRGA